MYEAGKRFSISGISQEENFAARADAFDQLDFLPSSARVDRLRAIMSAVDERLFQRLRPLARTHLRALIDTYVPASSEPGYDTLDLFLQKLLPGGDLPVSTVALEPDMVFYQKTPARIILRLTEYLHPTDVFFDLGSGLGQAVLLVHLLTGIPSNGIEIEPAYVAYARRAAETLGLDVTFDCMDARHADYTGGTVFFLYTPFRGALLQTVLARLRDATPRRLIAYGPCIADLMKQDWLQRLNNDDEPAVFTSLS